MFAKKLTIVLVTLALSLLVGLACTTVQNAAAKPVAVHSQFGVITADITGPSSTAVTADFTEPFESDPVCTDGIQPTTLSAEKMTEGARFEVVLMAVSPNSVTFFIHNRYETTESVAIHWHCIGQ